MSVLPPLCSLDDATAAGADPDLVTPALLEAASRRFRDAARHPITPSQHRRHLPIDGTHVQLPATPVLDVAGVWRTFPTGPPRPVIGWQQHHDLIDLAGVRMPGWLTAGPPSLLLVEWTAGYQPIPTQVRHAVAAMAARATCDPTPGMPVSRVGITPAEQTIAATYQPATTTDPIPTTGIW